MCAQLLVVARLPSNVGSSHMQSFVMPYPIFFSKYDHATVIC